MRVRKTKKCSGQLIQGKIDATTKTTDGFMVMTQATNTYKRHAQ